MTKTTFQHWDVNGCVVIDVDTLAAAEQWLRNNPDYCGSRIVVCDSDGLIADEFETAYVRGDATMG